MDGCVLLTSTPSCVVSPRGETTHSGVDVNNTHPSMINPLNKFYNYETRQSEQYHIPYFRTKLGQSSLRFSGAKMWNSIHNPGFVEEVSDNSLKKNS